MREDLKGAETELWYAPGATAQLLAAALCLSTISVHLVVTLRGMAKGVDEVWRSAALMAPRNRALASRRWLSSCPCARTYEDKF